MQKMENDRNNENNLLDKTIEEKSVLVGKVVGTVQNAEKKQSNIFFFGQPGCLKHSPIKTFSTESITSLNSFKITSTLSSVDNKEKLTDENNVKSEENNINNELLISKQNDDENSNKNNNENDLKTQSSSENVVENSSSTSHEKENENTHNSEEILLPSSRNDEEVVENVQLKSPRISIVPYEDDDDSSTSQIEIQNNQQDSNEKSEAPQLVESASLICEEQEELEEKDLKTETSDDKSTSKTENDILNVEMEVEEPSKIEAIDEKKEQIPVDVLEIEQSVSQNENQTHRNDDEKDSIVPPQLDNIEEMSKVQQNSQQTATNSSDFCVNETQIELKSEKDDEKIDENEQNSNLTTTPVDSIHEHMELGEGVGDENKTFQVDETNEGQSDLKVDEQETEIDGKVLNDSEMSVDDEVENAENLENSETQNETQMEIEHENATEIEENSEKIVENPQEIEENLTKVSTSEENFVEISDENAEKMIENSNEIENESKFDEIEKTEIENFDEQNDTKEKEIESEKLPEESQEIQQESEEISQIDEIRESIMPSNEPKSPEKVEQEISSQNIESPIESCPPPLETPAETSQPIEEEEKIEEPEEVENPPQIQEMEKVPEVEMTKIESTSEVEAEPKIEKVSEPATSEVENEIEAEEILEEKKPESEVQVEEISAPVEEIPTPIEESSERKIVEEAPKELESESENEEIGDHFEDASSPAVPGDESDEEKDRDEPEEEQKISTENEIEEKEPENDQKLAADGEVAVEQKPENDLKEIVESAENFNKPIVTRKRKISERKSVSESDSDSNVATDVVQSQDNSSEEEEVAVKKPRMRGKTTTPKKAPAARRTLRARKQEKSPEKVEEIEEKPTEVEKVEEKPKDEDKTLQNFQFDYDGNEDIVANIAAIKTLICKDKKSSDSENSDEGSSKKVANKRGRKGKRGRFTKSKDAESSDEDNKRSKATNEGNDATPKKRNSGRGLLKYIDTSLVIETVENETPVRQSRRIAQLKIKEETDRRMVEEKMLEKMKNESEKKKKEPIDEDYEKESSDDESVKGKRKRKSKIKASDKQWQTSSSHSEKSDQSEDELEHIPSDPGSPLFKSDHEFSPESEDDDEAQQQPLKRARTAKKVEVEDADEDINPNHACQVCHKTDSPEWILLCDECDCGYHCSCLKPIIFLIPSGNWYCPKCCHKRLIGNLSEQLEKLDVLVQNIETAELRLQRQKMLEINAQNIIEEERRKKRERIELEVREKSSESENSKKDSSDSDSSDDAPLIYKLRKRNQTATSYRFNEYDELINSAIKEEMDEVKGAGNLGRGKDISTIIEADKEEKRNLKREFDDDDDQNELNENANDDGQSSGSDVIRRKKSTKRKKKSRKLNNLDSSSEQSDADESFKGSTPSSDSEVDEEDLSMSSVSESSLDLPRKKGANARQMRTRTRQKRFDHTFINDNDSNDSDDEPLVRAKRVRKKVDSDEEDFDGNDDDDDDENSENEDIDSEDLCDDTESSDSSESAWPKKKKKRVASYDPKPRKPAKKKIVEDEDKAFRAGISKKKILQQKQSENESESEEESGGGKGRRTRGKKLLYLIEDDLESDESDGIRPGVKRPETPPEEREMFFKKQEEIKRMLAAKDTEAAKKLAAPTIEPFNIPLERPESPTFTDDPSSLSTIPMNVIESAKALDTDYNRVKPFYAGMKSHGSNMASNEMNEEELAKMMEDEDFAQHQLKLAGDAIAKKKLLEFEGKDEAFVGFNKSGSKEISPEKQQKRPKKPKVDKILEEIPKSQSPLQLLQASTANLTTPPVPPLMSSQILPQTHPKLQHPHHGMQPSPNIVNYGPPSQASAIIQNSPYVPSNVMMPDRPSVLSNYMNRPLNHPPPHHMKILQSPSPPPHHLKQLQSPPPASVGPPPPQIQMMPKTFSPKSQPQIPIGAIPPDEDMKKARRKKQQTRPEMVEGNLSKLAKLEGPPSVIHPPMNAAGMMERHDEKSKGSHNVKLSVAAPPQIFNPGTAPTPSVITRLLQPQQRPPGPYPQGLPPTSAEAQNIRLYQPTESSPSKNLPPSSKAPPQQGLPASSFAEHPAFVPRAIHHTLYRGPPNPYGIPPHARLPPYPFHLHPTLRPATPYNIPPQFGYYAPPSAHGRQPGGPMPLHGSPHIANNEDISNSIRNPNNSEENNENNSSEFGGLVSYFSSQQELD